MREEKFHEGVPDFLALFKKRKINSMKRAQDFLGLKKKQTMRK